MGSCHGKMAGEIDNPITMTDLNLNSNSKTPVRLVKVKGSDDDLILSFNVAGFKAYVVKMLNDEEFLVTAVLVGQPIPKTAAQAKKLLKKLERKGGDFVDTNDLDC